MSLPRSSARPRLTGLHLGRLGQIVFWMMAAVALSRVIGYIRNAYIAYAFGANKFVDVYVAAFTLPNWLNYLAAGGTLSITFITLFSGYLARGEEEEGYRVFSTVLNFLFLFLATGVALGEWLAPRLLRLYLPAFSPAQLALCIRLTRILLPAQICFGLGAILSALLYARGRFFLPAVAPLVYSLFVIFGGVLLRARLGIDSLAWGALAGALLGPLLLPLAGARQAGLRYFFQLRLRHPGFREWLRLTWPLMIGVTLVSADDWIMQPLAAHVHGLISLLNYAKRLDYVPIAVLGQAVGQAGMPFFARLASEGDWKGFGVTLERTVWRTAAGALLVSSAMAALSLPLVRLIYQRGLFLPAAARATAFYLALFLLALVFWSVQNLYARAFYAAGNTLTPMLAGTLLTAAMIPVYIFFAHRWRGLGLVLASDLGIALYAVLLGWLLSRRGLLLHPRRRRGQLARLLLLCLVAGGAALALVRLLEPARYRWLPELGVLTLAGLVWMLLAALLARALRLDPLLREAMSLLRRAALKLGWLKPDARDDAPWRA